MFDKPQSSHTFGLDRDGLILMGAALTQARGKVSVDTLFESTLEQEQQEGEQPRYNLAIDAKEKISALSETHLLGTAAPTQDVLVRPLELRLRKATDIDAAVPFQAESILPYPVENAVIDKIILSKGVEGSSLTVVALRKDHLEEQLKVLEASGITPEVVSAAPQALTIAADKFLNKRPGPYYVLHLGFEKAFCIVVDSGKLIAAQALPQGIAPLAAAAAKGDQQLQEAYDTIDLATASETVKETFESLRMAVTRTAYALAKQFKGQEISDLLITGPGAVNPMIATALCAAISKTQLTIVENSIENASPADLLRYSIPIGIALTTLPGCKDQINFRQGEFSYPEPWKRLKYPLLQYFALCLGIALSIIVFGKAYAAYQEGQIRSHYLDLLTTMHKTFAGFEKEYRTKNPFTDEGQGDSTFGPQNLSMDDIQARVAMLEKEIASTPQIFPLQPNVPLVSDVLAWIANHPAFGAGPKAGDSALHIENFTYTLVKRPEPTKKQEKYQVKVELEFSSPTPKMAREFHDALIAPNDIVDLKGEIKWSSNKDKYKTSFFLKDKTTYSTM